MASRCVRLLSFILVFAAAAARAQEARTLPLDPLTPPEQEEAARIAQADARVKELLGDRTRLIYTEFIAVKPATAAKPQEEAPPTGRFADVLFIRYDTNVGLRVLVDLAAKKVSEVVRISGRSVPINTDEVEQAARLALADERVVRLLGPQAGTFRVARAPATSREATENRIEGLRSLGTTAADPCYAHRCIVLFFRQANRYILLNQVVVDLTTQRVMLRGGEK